MWGNINCTSSNVHNKVLFSIHQILFPFTSHLSFQSTVYGCRFRFWNNPQFLWGFLFLWWTVVSSGNAKLWRFWVWTQTSLKWLMQYIWIRRWVVQPCKLRTSSKYGGKKGHSILPIAAFPILIWTFPIWISCCTLCILVPRLLFFYTAICHSGKETRADSSEKIC